ncbi:MAG TPA: hypothetical protein VEJ20_07285 [Candidatus Eremiobacteraceae bacterium]|nr:hypothetical protein [Candidatus Eremiobacteraceae bacterium]
MAEATETGPTPSDLPAALPFPFTLNVRNSDLGLDDAGTVVRLDETRAVMSLHREVPVGTVMFTSIDIRTLNTTARGLMRVTAQQTSPDGLAYETFAEFVELGDDAKKKIGKVLGRPEKPVAYAGSSGMARPAPMPTRNFAMDQLGVQPVYQRGGPARNDYQVATERSYFEPSPLRQQAKATAGTKFWNSLGVTAYIAIALIIIAFFPVGRAYELMIWNKIIWGLGRMWYWANHIGDVKLYNNS